MDLWLDSQATTPNVVRHELAQSSEYPVRPGVIDCKHYLITGQCSYGGHCIFNHPPLPEGVRHETVVQSSPYPLRPGVIDCKHYLRTGHCGYGSNCHFNHPPPTLAPELPERINFDTQDTILSLRFDERRDETESSSIPEKREYVVAGYKRVRIEQGEGNFGWQRVEAEEIVEEQRERQSIWLRKRQAQENVERETEESFEERRLKFLEEQRQREIEKQKREDEERRRDIERQRSESRVKLEQMKPTVEFDEVSRIREALPELGITKKDGDGF